MQWFHLTDFHFSIILTPAVIRNVQYHRFANTLHNVLSNPKDQYGKGFVNTVRQTQRSVCPVPTNPAWRQSISFMSLTWLESLHGRSAQKDVYSKRRVFWHKVKGLWMALSEISALILVSFLCSSSKLTGTHTHWECLWHTLQTCTAKEVTFWTCKLLTHFTF